MAELDLDLHKYNNVLDVVLEEIIRAKKKHGLKEFNSTHEGYAVLLEEVDEMWEDVKKDRKPESVEEAIQVAAMAVRYAAELGTAPYKIHKPTKPAIDA